MSSLLAGEGARAIRSLTARRLGMAAAARRSRRGQYKSITQTLPFGSVVIRCCRRTRALACIYCPLRSPASSPCIRSSSSRLCWNSSHASFCPDRASAAIEPVLPDVCAATAPALLLCVVRYRHACAIPNCTFTAFTTVTLVGQRPWSSLLSELLSWRSPFPGVL